MPNEEHTWPPAALLTVGETAAYFRVSTATILRWCAAGKIPTCKIGREWRIPWDQLQAQIQAEATSSTTDEDSEDQAVH